MRKSVYLQLVAVFVAIMFISNLVVFSTFFFSTQVDVLREADTTLTALIGQLRFLETAGQLSPNQIESLIGISHFRGTAFATLDELAADPRFERFFTPLDLATFNQSGEVRSRAPHKGGHFVLPAAILHLRTSGGERYLLVSPDLRRMLFNFRGVIGTVNLSSLIVGSLIALVVARYSVRSIKKLSAAMQEVSKGNFAVSVDEKRHDEMGQLIKGFNYMASELQKIEMLRSDFISAISHEFKTPLSAIKGYAKLLAETESEAERKEGAAIIVEESERLSRLSSNILLLSRLEHESAELHRETFRLDEQLRKVVLLLERQWMEKDLELELELDEVLYFGSEELLFQVWLNVLDNAIKFSHRGGRVAVSLKQADDRLLCVITDGGFGLSPEHYSRVFEKFYQADKSRSTQGNGLGLPIAKRIIEMHGGEISLAPAPTAGIAVTMKL